MSDTYIKCPKCGKVIHFWFADEYVKHDCNDESGMPDTRFGTQACKNELESHGIPFPFPVSDAFTGSASDICENCRYGKRTERLTSEGTYHSVKWSCHFLPPDKHDMRDGWPLVDANDFCGEFRAKPVEEASDGD